MEYFEFDDVDQCLGMDVVEYLIIFVIAFSRPDYYFFFPISSLAEIGNNIEAVA